MEIHQYAFHIDRLADAAIFKIPETGGSEVFVADAFVRVVKAAGLTGFVFEQVG